MCDGWKDDNVEELAEFRVKAEKWVSTVVDGEGVNDPYGTVAREDGVATALEEISAEMAADVCEGSLCPCACTCKIHSRSGSISSRIYTHMQEKEKEKKMRKRKGKECMKIGGRKVFMTSLSCF